MPFNPFKPFVYCSLLMLSLTGCALIPQGGFPAAETHVNQPAVAKTTPPTPVENHDVEFSKKIIGTWQDQMLQEGLALQVEESFFPANKFSGTAQAVSSAGETLLIRYSGTWKIQDGYLHYKITSSNIPDIIPVGVRWTRRGYCWRIG